MPTPSSAPLRAVRTARGTGVLPQQASLIEIEPPECVLSSLKVAEDDDAIVARVYNIASQAVEGSVRLQRPFTSSSRTDLNEEHPTPLATEDGAVSLSLKPNEIATLKFKI